MRIHVVISPRSRKQFFFTLCLAPMTLVVMIQCLSSRGLFAPPDLRTRAHGAVRKRQDGLAHGPRPAGVSAPSPRRAAARSRPRASTGGFQAEVFRAAGLAAVDMEGAGGRHGSPAALGRGASVPAWAVGTETGLCGAKRVLQPAQRRASPAAGGSPSAVTSV